MTDAERAREWRRKNPEKVKTYQKMRYKRDRKQIIEAATKWKEDNPERWNESHRKATSKYSKTQKGKITMAKYNKRYKSKNLSRGLTRGVVYGYSGYKPSKLPEGFLICNCGEKKIQLHHSVYPRTKPGVLEAIKNKEIVALCNPCHVDEHKRLDALESSYLSHKESKNG